jgi:hypothetical protein
VFPLYSPMIDSIEVVRRGKVRRAKLYYLRGRRGKSARIIERQDYAVDETGGEEVTAKESRAKETGGKEAGSKEVTAKESRAKEVRTKNKGAK